MAKWLVETHQNVQPLIFFLFHGQGAEGQFSANSGLLTRFFFSDVAIFAFLHTARYLPWRAEQTG